MQCIIPKYQSRDMLIMFSILNKGREKRGRKKELYPLFLGVCVGFKIATSV
jgi:hypothetical protein